MQRKGLQSELIRNTLEDKSSDADERTRALRAARREWAGVPEGADGRKAASKVSRKLVSLGYTYEVIGEVMSELMKGGDEG
jgi:SOS response regulatory protein OraA/RecX